MKFIVNGSNTNQQTLAIEYFKMVSYDSNGIRFLVECQPEILNYICQAYNSQKRWKEKYLQLALYCIYNFAYA